MALLKWGCNGFPPPIFHCWANLPWGERDLGCCGHERHKLGRIHEEPQRVLWNYCGVYVCFFAVWWAGNLVAWAEWLPMSVWYNMSANARLSCQEIKPTEYTFIAKNYVKFLLLWGLVFCLFFFDFGEYFFRVFSGFWVSFSPEQEFYFDLCLARISCFHFYPARASLTVFCQESDSTSILQSCYQSVLTAGGGCWWISGAQFINCFCRCHRELAGSFM